MMKRLIALASCGGLLMGATAPALHPSGPWVVQEDDLGCEVTRQFAGDADVEYGFTTHLTGTDTIMAVVAPKDMLPDGIGSIRLSVAGGQAGEVHYGAFPAASPKARLVKLFPDRAMTQSIAAAPSFEIGKTPLRLSTEGVTQALKALDDCTVRLLTSWGADPQRYRDGKFATPTGNVGTWFTRDDYRRVIRPGFKDGMIVVLITTSPEGVPVACKTIRSPDPRIDAGTCEIAMKRARFLAPLGEDGKPMASYFIMPVLWN